MENKKYKTTGVLFLLSAALAVVNRILVHIELLSYQGYSGLADANLEVQAFAEQYVFLLNGREIARVDTKLLSTEMAGGFTGVTVGPYCRTGKAAFHGFDYKEE